MSENKDGYFKKLGKALFAVKDVDRGVYMSPQQPLQPVAQQEAGRAFDYPVGFNIQTTPRGSEPISFNQLRALSDNCDILRLAIETRKDQISRFNYKFVVKNNKNKTTNIRTKELDKFFLMPDKEHNFDEWLRMLIEDLLVIDAPTIYPRKTLGGALHSLEVIDGGTIKRVIDRTGRTPKDGVSPAYQQNIKGMPAVDYTYNELIYKPRNIRSNKIYGYSPVEQVIGTVNILLRKTVNQLEYYTNGNTPNLLFTAPAEWNPDQIRKFQAYWDEQNMGMSKTHAKMVPNGVTPYNTKPEPLKDVFDEWLTRIVMFAFSLPPTAFITDTNRATANTTATLAKEEGLSPLLDYVKNLINFIILTQFGYEDVEFNWDIEEATDPLIKAQINNSYVASGVLTVNEVRQELGLDPFPEVEEIEEKPFEDTLVNDEEEGEETDTPAEKIAKKKSLKKDIKLSKKVIAAQKGIEKIIEQYLNAQKEKVLSQLNNIDKSILIKKDYDLDIEIDATETLSIIKKLTEYLKSIGEQVIESVFSFLGINSKTKYSKALKVTDEYIQRRAAELVGKKFTSGGKLIDNPNASYVINETTRADLKILINKAMQDGLSNQEIAKQIQDAHMFSKERASMIARTETNMADNNITVDTYKEVGIKKKQWLTAQDDLVSEDCQKNEEAGAIDIDDDFPSGDYAPPCHPNCRCTILAVEE
ncbi:MAG: hypothetical protein QG564_1812 [Campylobacterota bacterium]|nr:hypothetical protein [Campylobacterota bacterium]